MMLTLEIIGTPATAHAGESRKVFHGIGGTIGRQPENDWVLAHPYVSGRHALIRYVNGVYYIEDMSRNGVFINTLDNRVERDRPYALQSGDRILVDPFEIRVSIAPSQETSDPFAASDPFADDVPFAPAAARTPVPPRAGDPLPGVDPMPGEVVDPLDLLGLQAPAPRPPAPKASDLARHSVLSDHYQPPPVNPAPPGSPERPGALIPDSYDPLTPGDSVIVSPSARGSGDPGAAPVAPPRSAETAPPVPARDAPPRGVAPPAPLTPPAPRAATPSSARAAKRGDARPAAAAAARPDQVRGAGDLSEVLAGAGIEGVDVTPELARNFGRILQVVVGGVMDVLQARQRLKDEFRMGMTTFKPADNNPLKFSANVEDALHNLLVKRNAAYLGPVEAFEDAFDDIRNHQMAMFAGVRMAFEAMLAEFDPARLEEQFERQSKKGALLAMPARLRCWDLYREKFRDMVKDPDTCFRELFGEEFAAAYEQQLARLKAQPRNREQ